MSKTNCTVTMKFIDVTASEDSTFSSQTKSSFSDLDKLIDEDNRADAFGTMELNQFVLDGSKSVMADTAEVAYWSAEESSQDRASTASISVSFDNLHTSSGITLIFSDVPPAKIKVVWMADSVNSLAEEVFYPDSLKYFCNKQVSNYHGIKVYILETAFPKRFAKIDQLIYGQDIVWSGEDIMSASVVEEIDVTSATLSINTASVTVNDSKAEYDVSNPDGLWQSVQKNQEVIITETKDGVSIPCGTFFVDKFSYTNNTAKFELIDSVGLLDKYTFRDGKVYNLANVEDVLKDVFDTAGIEKYDIDENIEGLKISGYLGIMTCREAIQQICFAIGAVADDSRSDTISVYKPSRYVRSTIGIDRKFYGKSKTTLTDYVSGISISYSKYSIKGTGEAFKDTLGAGINRVEFSNPYDPSTLTVSGATLVSANWNYAVVNVSTSGEVTISGTEYEGKEYLYTKNVAELEPGENENVKEFSGLTLYSPIILDVVNSLFDYYALRKQADIQYLIGTENVGEWVIIKDVEGNASATLVERQTIDLTGGFIATAVCHGYSTVTTANYYTGELFAGEVFGIA